MKTAVLISAGQPSTNPRLVKGATLLAASGFQVTVLYAHWTAWADGNDKELFRRYPQIAFERVGGHPVENRSGYNLSRLLHKGAKLALRFFPNSTFLIGCSYHRAYPLLSRRARKLKADVYVSHNLAALPAAVLAAENNRAVSVADLEDFFRGQHLDNSEANGHAIAIEQRFIPRATRCITASPMITAAYKQLFPATQMTTIRNVFSKENLRNAPHENTNRLKLFWFSQTVGRQRGLEEVIEAMGLLNSHNISLTILGDCSAEISSFLLRLAAQHNVNREQINFVTPKPLDAIFELAGQHDIGLALEAGISENNRICLSNKLFTYLLSGLAIVASDTPAQAAFLKEHPSIGFVHRTGDKAGLVNLLNRFVQDRVLLERCKESSRQLAAKRFNWEEESKIYRSLIDSCFA